MESIQKRQRLPNWLSNFQPLALLNRQRASQRLDLLLPGSETSTGFPSHSAWEPTFLPRLIRLGKSSHYTSQAIFHQSHWFTLLQPHLLFLSYQAPAAFLGRVFQATTKLAASLPSGLCSNVTSSERLPWPHYVTQHRLLSPDIGLPPITIVSKRKDLDWFSCLEWHEFPLTGTKYLLTKWLEGRRR